jgi:hypothetical protein
MGGIRRYAYPRNSLSVTTGEREKQEKGEGENFSYHFWLKNKGKRD